LQAGQRYVWLYVRKLHQEISEDKLTEHIKKGITRTVKCEQLDTLDHYRAFKMGIPYEDLEAASNPEFWPTGVLVRTFRFRRERNTGARLNSTQRHRSRKWIYQPGTQTQNIITDIDEALQPVIITGDFNCRAGKMDSKARIFFEYLSEEGFTLTNEHKVSTYNCHNGKSTIDLFKNDSLERKSIKILTDIASAPLRKHQPVIAFIQTSRYKKPGEHTTPMPEVLQTLVKEVLHEAKPDLSNIRNNIKENRLNEAVKTIHHIITAAQHTQTITRKAKP
ncbi:hypothetical protein ANN_10679, partial [Periplaneta americana]